MKGFFPKSTWSRPKSNYDHSLPHCGRCRLFKNCFTPRMEHSGTGEKKILFVGSAPGETDDKMGSHFMGESGDFLRKCLHDIDEELNQCWSTYSVICHPEGGKTTDDQIESCRPNILKTIKTLKPEVIILLGIEAVRSIIGFDWKRNIGQIEKWIGWNIPQNKFNAWVCPVRDPVEILRKNQDQILVEEFKTHLETAFALEGCSPNAQSLSSLESEIELLTNEREVRSRLRDLSKKEGVLAFDYETTGLKPDNPKHSIVSCSFCLEDKETWACKIDSGNLKLLSKVLRNDKLEKIASNLKFEDRWTKAKMGHFVYNWIWDTMIAAHILDNRSGITSVKFQSFIHLGIVGYEEEVDHLLKGEDANSFNQIHEIDDETLLKYNALDSLLEYKIAMKQMEMFYE